MEAAEKLYEARALIRRRRAMNESGIIRSKAAKVVSFFLLLSLSFAAGFFVANCLQVIAVIV